jgi:hypothetical protein
MQRILLFVLGMLAILFFGSFSTAFGEMMSSTVGVAKGDFFRYSYSCYFISNDPNAVPPADFTWINQTDYFMINVTRVSGDSVSFSTMLLGLNGSSNLGVCSMNVGTGGAMISGYGGPSNANNLYFMARNIGMMGRMFPSSSVSPTINDTFMMTYVEGSRLTNHFSTTTNRSGTMTNLDFYYDQATGMMVQWRQETIQTNGNLQTNSTQMMKVTASSVWVVPEFPTSMIVPIFIVAASVSLVALGIAKIKRVHRQSRYSPSIFHTLN